MGRAGVNWNFPLSLKEYFNEKEGEIIVHLCDVERKIVGHSCHLNNTEFSLVDLRRQK